MRGLLGSLRRGSWKVRKLRGLGVLVGRGEGEERLTNSFYGWGFRVESGGCHGGLG
jgi:hypothetical protein